ncbi:MAG: acyl carrier protein [Tepidisphaeraceae bacterium]
MAEQLTMPAIEQRLCTEIQILLALKPGDVSPDMSLRSLGMDSLRFVSLLIVIEKAFGLSLMKAGLKREAVQSVRTLAAAIHAGTHP